MSIIINNQQHGKSEKPLEIQC